MNSALRAALFAQQLSKLRLLRMRKAKGMFESEPLVGPARERALRGDIAVHDHVCGIYETRREGFEPAFRFLKLGLERHEQCMYIAENDTPAVFLSFLQSRGVSVQDAMACGALQVVSGKDMRLKLGGFSPSSMLTFLAGAERTALSLGFAGFRWAADMTWLCKDNIKAVDAFRFEADLNRFLLEHEAAGLCQYSMEDFQADFLIAAVETHRLLVYQDIVCDNFYYVPPEEYLNPKASDMRLQRLLGNVISRERLMASYLSQVRGD